MAFDANKGTNKLANVLSERMKKESASPLVLDFGEIQANGSLVTNTFPVPIPKGDYSVLRKLTLGAAGSVFTETSAGGEHEHTGGEHEGHTSDKTGEHEHSGGQHVHPVILPEKMRSVGPGDRVLVAWVHSEAVVIDIVTGS